MKIDKYKGYWKVKGENIFIEVIGYSVCPRWRRVKRFCRNARGYYRYIDTAETVDYLRLKCEKITEDTFKEYINK